MSESTIVKTVLEYAVMPIQRYEFVCSGCFMVKALADHGTGSHCKECL
jgi:hypothetical protein